jgi:hypothetical protein
VIKVKGWPRKYGFIAFWILLGNFLGLFCLEEIIFIGKFYMESENQDLDKGPRSGSKV